MTDPTRKRQLEELDQVTLCARILCQARSELYVNMKFLDVSLSSLGFEADWAREGLGTDGHLIHYGPDYLLGLYKRGRTLVNRGYLHMLFHCLFCHMYTRKGRKKDLWDLACDVAVESILDELDYPCLAGGFVPAKQKFYGECRAEMPVLTAEGIYRHLLRLDLPEYEVARLQRTFLVDDHGLWDPDQQDQEQQKQREQKWQGVSEKPQTGLETVLAGKATGGEVRS